MFFHVPSRIIIVFNLKDPMNFTANIIMVMMNATINWFFSALFSNCISCYATIGDSLNYHDTTTCQGSPVSPFPGKWHICTFFLNYVSKLIPEIQLKDLTLGLHLNVNYYISWQFMGIQIRDYEENLIKRHLWRCEQRTEKITKGRLVLWHVLPLGLKE